MYHDPATDRLTWISWDHNLVLGGTGRFGGGGGFGGQGGGFGGPGGMGGRSEVSIDKDNVGSNWPLIRFLLDDPAYHAKYVSELAALRTEIFDADALATKYRALAEWLAPYAIQESSQAAYDTAVQQLTDKLEERAALADEFLAENR